MSVNVSQLNCQHSYDVMCELGTIMVNRNIEVALLQEPQSDIDVTLVNNEFTSKYTGDWTMSEVDN